MSKLANSLKPTSIDQIIGQTKLLSPKGLIYKMVENKFSPSLIFYGPPGVGKTSLAISLANDLNYKYEIFNAAFDKKELLLKYLTTNGETKVLIIDEIHRMNKDKQDILLEVMEKGLITVYATTTENPFFVINPAIRSRATLIPLEMISSVDLHNYVLKSIANGNLVLNITNEAIVYLCHMANGDARVLINNLEILINLFHEEITLELVTNLIPNSSITGSGYGDEFHHLKSALQKSIRGSDVDAALYYFARLFEIGDYQTLTRRMMVIAYEDIGMANPAIGPRVFHAVETFNKLGPSEGIIPLGLAIVEMSLSEKSNSALLATQTALELVKKGFVYDIPNHLKDNHYQSASKLGHGKGYKYPHNYQNDWVAQEYLPTEMKDVKIYQPKLTSAYEKRIHELYLKMKTKSK